MKEVNFEEGGWLQNERTEKKNKGPVATYNAEYKS